MPSHVVVALGVAAGSFVISASGAFAEETAAGFTDPIHGYRTQPPTDRFSRFKTELDAGRRQLDVTDEKAMLLSLLRELEIPVESQLLVYSSTSLQKAIVNPRNPRALYFNDDTYVGFVPGGRMEIASLDPQLGTIFYIFDGLRQSREPRVERTESCMTCHAPYYLNDIPALIVESVVPGMTGGGEKAFRREQSGHGIPFELRFGGWHVTGAPPDLKHWGNVLMEYTGGGRRERTLRLGELFDLQRYPLPNSDILPHLLHEHQVGFANRMIGAAYETRALLEKPGRSEDIQAELDRLARPLVRYLLFADEVPLPAGGIAGEPSFKAAFVASAKRTSDGSSLKQLDLNTRLLRLRCSYMIYSPPFTGLPSALKERVWAELDRALGDTEAPDYQYLPQSEKRAIRAVLIDTAGDLPPAWSRNVIADS